ncbi:dna ligase 4 [Fusarium albosuccineum]|uniref:Dna ligase 4 n=1 Tax=Fusarium albosuccineum TaxID=1237068 RepID=A0A8H4KU46_9HYPO|nr:dna ligase 4 [Fusarium albosuccineum]
MPLPFLLVSGLLEQAHELSVAKKSTSSVIARWFTEHRSYISAHDTSLSALLSTLLPDKRTDRVYCIQAPTLEKIIGRAFFLGSSRIVELSQYRQPGLGIDLADCVSRILTATPSPGYSQKNPVTVEEIDEILHGLAAKVRWSSPSIRASQASLTQGNRGDLEWLYRRLSATEAKWFTRLVLKNYEPLVLDPHLIFRLCDPILPCVLKIQDDFATAINSVQAIRGRLLPNAARNTPREQILSSVKPQLGVKVGRQPWVKGRSIKHCLDMGHRRMSVEDKIDGEYCQIHIDLSKGERCIQIFSKSGKDSTEDREALHGIGRPDAKITKACILEGELVAYDDSQQNVLPFHKIRKHVSRRGLFLNAEQDSLPGPQEHLMIIYYDIMLLEDQSLINLRHSERFKILSNLINCRKGWAELVQRQVIDFGLSLGASSLRKAFALTILARKEGLVLKPDEPYFDFADQRRKFSSCCIKLKKEYIGNFGDVGDFAVVGARYDPAKATTYRIAGLRWTHFYLGCLDNREAVKQWNAKPEFTIVNVVELNETMLREIVTYATPDPVAPRENDKLVLKLAPGVEQGLPLTVVFTKPLVFDLRCFSFDKVGNTGFWSPRFPSVTKVHFDRDFKDTISFEQLQTMAQDATTVPELEDSQENLQWIAKLEAADPRGIAVDAVSQLTVTTMPTPSPRRSTQNTTSSWSPTSPLAARFAPLVQMSPSRPRFEPPNPLPVLPPMSTPAATTSSIGEPPPHKRGSPSSRLTPSCKRQKSERGTSQTSTPSANNDNSSQSRRPLMDINANSQFANPTSLPQPQSRLEQEPSKVIDLTSSTEASFTTATTTMTPTSPLSHSSPPTENATVVTLPDSSKPAKSQPLVLKELPDGIETARDTCRFAGTKCRMAKRSILVSPRLLNYCEEAKALFDDHGIYGSAMDVNKWLETEEACKDGTPSKPGEGTYLLVDSERGDETKALLAKVEETCRLMNEERRNWIEVHDWRMLNYVTIKEDENVTPKYYDGWHDPWRRWYIGIV